MAELIAPRKTVSVSFSLEPAYSAMASLSLLELAESFDGLGEWVYRTAGKLSPEERRTNWHVLHDAAHHLLGDIAWPNFEVWVDDLASRDAKSLRDEVVRSLFAKAWSKAGQEPPDPDEILSDRDAFITLLERARAGHREPEDRALWEDIRGFLIDPPLVQERIVTHLRAMWKGGLSAEWERHRPLLQESIAAFRPLDLSGLTALEAMTRVSMREVPPPASPGGWLDQVERIIFIPSAHTGPYLLHLGGLDETTVRIVYGARVPEEAVQRSLALTRSELLIRLNALANDVRLRILELLGREGELSTAEIMERLDLSQSAASRHLEHLSATGYLTVRAEKRVKTYRLSVDQIDHTLSALKAFCQGGRR